MAGNEGIFLSGLIRLHWTFGRMGRARNQWNIWGCGIGWCYGRRDSVLGFFVFLSGRGWVEDGLRGDRGVYGTFGGGWLFNAMGGAGEEIFLTG